MFLISLYLVIKGATFSTKYAAQLAEKFHLSKYAIGFIIVSVISILPEAFISINSAIEQVPLFGLSVLFGSNVADLTLIFAIIIFANGRRLKIESKILKDQKFFPLLLILPLLFGIDGSFSRIEGLALIFFGVIFYYSSLRKETATRVPIDKKENKFKDFLFLLLSMSALLLGAHFTVTSATALANYFKISSVLIGILVVGLGTTLPELFFSLKAAKKNDDSLAVGDIFGTVLADSTIVIGILALISPFSVPIKTISVTGVFMVIASIILLYFMRSDKNVSKKEGILLFLYWLVFILVEFFLNR
ncbi:MAG TPA: sodium:calcium antiporter [Candidatus Paceibacterota bacterium]|nr:sodium:calcium antiporter [Candidatus Paceibacterota bacterium]